MHVVRGHAGQVVTGRQLGQGIVARRVERIAVIPQFDHHPVTTEQLDEPLQLLGRCGRAVIDQRRRHRPLPTAGQHPTVAGHRVGDVEQAETWCALLARQMTEAQRTRQARVAHRPISQHEQVISVRVGRMVIGDQAGGDLALRLVFVEHLTSRCCAERDLGAEHGRQPHGPGRLGKANDTVETVVVGHRQRFEPQPSCFLCQLLGVRGAVEEREVGVTVQLRIWHRRQVGAHQRTGLVGLWRLVGLAFAAPGRAVATRVPRRRARGATIFAATGRGAVGERCFELPPRHVRVVEPHKGSDSIEHLFVTSSESSTR